MNSSTCLPSADASFGPVVGHQCRDGFDFTIVFEQSIFVLAPASLLLLAAPFRLFRLATAKNPVRVAGHRLRAIKLTTIGALAALQLTLTILWATSPLSSSARLVSSVSAAAACVSLASSVMSLFLSYAEHSRSPRPSTLLNVYLLVSLMLDAALLRTLWLSNTTVSATIAAVFSAAFGLKTLLVVLEGIEKGRFLAAAGDIDVGRVYAPSETAGLYSHAVFAWVLPLLRTGFRRLLRPADLYSLAEDMQTAGIDERFWTRWDSYELSKTSPSTSGITTDTDAANSTTVTTTKAKDQHHHRLLWSCLSTLKWSIAAVIPPRIFLLTFTICQPLAVDRFLQFLDSSKDADPTRNGYGLVGAYGLIYVGIGISNALYWYCNGRSVTMLRGLLVSAVFKKATEVRVTATDDAAAVTLMSTDVEVVVRACRQIHEFWANAVQVAIATYLLAVELNFAAVGPLAVCLIALAATFFSAPLGKKTRVAWLAKTQKRVGITSAMLGHIKSIKMSGLGTHLSHTISSLRLEEVSSSRPFRLLAAVTSSVAQVPLFLSPVAAFAIFQAVPGKVLDAQRLFAALSVIVLVTQPLFSMFEAVFDFSAAMAAFERIEKFLVESTRDDYREFVGETVGPVSAGEQSNTGAEDMELRRLRDNGSPMALGSFSVNAAVDVQNATFSWSPDRPILTDISLSVPQGHLTMLLGPVASGKTTLLKALLGEASSNPTGTVRLSSASLSWCDQSPWITNQTVKDNIVGYNPFRQSLYDQVVAACELKSDFAQLAQGDMTVVGSKGFTLSGGQKQRVSLARSVYAQPRIALFDDVFSGLDGRTARKVFANLFQPEKGLLRQWKTTIILATQSVKFLSSSDQIISLRDGRITESGTFVQLRSSGGYVQSLLQGDADQSSSDHDIPSEDDVEAAVEEIVKKQYKAKDAETDSDDARRQLGDGTVYRSYFGSVGVKYVVILLLLEVVWGFLQSFPTVWLNFWTEADPDDTSRRAGYYLGIYSFLQVTACFWFALLIWFVLDLVASKSGISLHQRLLTAVLRAPLSIFAKTDLGSITTRFSQDIGMIDNNLPLALVVSIACFFTLLAQAALLAASSYYVAISYPLLSLLIFYLQRGYLRTSRQIRLLDLEEKSPLYTQFLETLSGLATLRAFGWSRPAILRNHELVDRSQKPFFLLIMIQRWLVLVLDLTTAGLALLVVGFAVKLRGSVSVGLTGVGLVQLISVSETLSMLVQFWVQLETTIAAVARISQFSEQTPDENLPGEIEQVPANWPDRGHVIIENITAAYDESGDIKALDDLSLEIQPGEKIGICGRTGSGKSSLFLTILRLLDPSSGTLIIDSHLLTTLPRETIRSHIIAVTQDQFVLPGTVRQNLDPFGTHTDEDILDALEAVGLSRAVAAAAAATDSGNNSSPTSGSGSGTEEHSQAEETRAGLDAKFGEDMLSHGQKQLFFLARAVLRKETSKLVLLDEATSSVDQETEDMVRKVIESHFAEHTVVAIAHRLETVMGFDRIVVMDKGKAAEVGPPGELLRKPGGSFKALWEASRRGQVSTI